MAATGICLLVSGLLAFTSAGAIAPNISHSYQPDGSIANGSLVSLDPSNSSHVQLANSSNGSRLLGLALANNDSLLAVNASSTTIQVATAGTANALVSTLGGAIKAGDRISVSPFNGIGIKAVPNSYVIGLAQTGLDSHSTNTIPDEVTNKSGQTTKITVGYVRISIAIGTDSSGNDGNLNALQKLAKSLTGHTVSMLRLIVSLIITVVALVTLMTLIYSSIYSSIVSVGRNPLAQNAIIRTLILVIATAILTAAVTAFIIYLLLR